MGLKAAKRRCLYLLLENNFLSLGQKKVIAKNTILHDFLTIHRYQIIYNSYVFERVSLTKCMGIVLETQLTMIWKLKTTKKRKTCLAMLLLATTISLPALNV